MRLKTAKPVSDKSCLQDSTELSSDTYFQRNLNGRKQAGCPTTNGNGQMGRSSSKGNIHHLCHQQVVEFLISRSPLSFRKQQQQPGQDYVEELQGGGSLDRLSSPGHPWQFLSSYWRPSTRLQSPLIFSQYCQLYGFYFFFIQVGTLPLSPTLDFPPVFLVRSTQRWPETSYGCF
jgi:hypothetical protein